MIASSWPRAAFFLVLLLHCGEWIDSVQAHEPLPVEEAHEPLPVEGPHPVVEEHGHIEHGAHGAEEVHGEHGHDIGHGGGHGEHGHLHGEGPMGSAIGAMLIGAVAFQMSLFYLVNNKDDDIKRYSWIVIEMTISIFSAVLLFSAVEGVLKLTILHGLSHAAKLVANIIHFLWWFGFMQCFVLLVALREKAQEKNQGNSNSYNEMNDVTQSPILGQDKEDSAPGGRNITFGEEEVTEYEQEMTPRSGSSSSMCLNAKCWGGLVAHMAAFASIVAFNELQMMASEEVGAAGVYLTPVCVFLFFVALFTVAGNIRMAIINKDGQMDEVEKVWEHVVREIEDDVCGLCVSYLIARCVQFSLENTHNLISEHHVAHHSTPQIIECGVCALASAGIMVGLILWEKRKEEQEHGHGHGAHGGLNSPAIDTHRFFELAQIISSFAFAWNLLNVSTWRIQLTADKVHWTHIWTEVVEALLVSLASVGVIFLFDKIADLKSTPPSVDQAIRDLILALGVLIGFSWEHAFHIGIVDIAARVHEKMTWNEDACKFFGCTAITLIVLPAFRWYIVPKVFKLKEKKNREAHAEAKRLTDRLASGEEGRHRG